MDNNVNNVYVVAIPNITSECSFKKARTELYEDYTGKRHQQNKDSDTQEREEKQYNMEVL